MSIIEKALRREKPAFDDKSQESGSGLIEDLGDRDNVARGTNSFSSSVDKADSSAQLTRHSQSPDLDHLPDAMIPSELKVNSVGGGSSLVDEASKSGGAFIELPLDTLQSKGFLTPYSPRSRIAEEFRTIKRPLLRNISNDANRGAHPNLIMVTSALQGDGKTFSSINLAISLAMEQDKTVLFVDADVVRASAGRVFGIDKRTPGLIDLLDPSSEIDPSDVILTTSMEKLRILPAGNASDKSTELLASETMHNFMIELSNRYPDRVIVFDSPPLLLTTEASVLASFMGQIVFVASADVTPQHAVEEALEQIGDDKMLGVILNRASRRRSKLLGIGSYGYGYGYGYGQPSDHEKRADG